MLVLGVPIQHYAGFDVPTKLISLRVVNWAKMFTLLSMVNTTIRKTNTEVVFK